MFYGPSDPLNAVKGVGLCGPVDPAAWDAVEEVFRATKSPVVVDLCPLADDAFTALLSSRGYVIGSFETVNCQRLDATPPAADSASTQPLKATKRTADFEIQQVDPSNSALVSTWSRVIDLGFADGGEPMKFTVDFGKVRSKLAADRSSASSSAQHPTSHSLMFLATVKGEPAGGAGLSIYGQTAHFAGAAVLPKFRRRGIQTALTQARLRAARVLGCTLAKFDVRAGSISHHNAIRAGFQVAYTRPQLIKTWS